MTEASMLAEHGTVLARLKPINIVQAAVADLKLRERKAAHRDGGPWVDQGALYSFARSHVVRARSIEHLIALAYYEPHVALRTDKRSTLVVYRDVALLRETLRVLLQGEFDELQMSWIDMYVPPVQGDIETTIGAVT
jgi:hypothetical protein